jgi:hypothetical protein
MVNPYPFFIAQKLAKTGCGTSIRVLSFTRLELLTYSGRENES